jgi:hypothetical protein
VGPPGKRPDERLGVVLPAGPDQLPPGVRQEAPAKVRKRDDDVPDENNDARLEPATQNAERYEVTSLLGYAAEMPGGLAVSLAAERHGQACSGRAVLGLEHLESPDLALCRDRSPVGMLTVGIRELRRLHPSAEVLLGRPAGVDEVAPVLGWT